MVRMVRFGFYGKELGHFVSSTYYGESLPDWLIELNASGQAEALMAQGWDRLHDESVYAQCLPDNNPYEGAFRGELKPTFPYDLQSLRENRTEGTTCSRARPVETR